MLSGEVVEEKLVVEEVLFAEVAPGMREDFGLSVIAWVSVLNMGFEFLDVVDPLLPNEYESAFETNLAEGFLVFKL